jgi:tetratricopeptide (TPR) repeat protein
MVRLRNLLITGTVLAFAALAAPALAAGGAEPSNGGNGGNGGNNGASDSRNTKPTCQAGYVSKNGSCVRADRGVLPDEELYRQGRALALSHYYAEALPILMAIDRIDDSMVFTMQGFAMRKLGHYNEGLALYDKALAIDPDNINTHEYMGEYYVEVGDLGRARVELAKVERICGGIGCEQYEDLAEAIETGKSE